MSSVDEIKADVIREINALPTMSGVLHLGEDRYLALLLDAMGPFPKIPHLMVDTSRGRPRMMFGMFNVEVVP